MRTRSLIAMLSLAASLAACSSGAPAPTGAASTTATQPATSLQPQPLPTGSFALPSFVIPSFVPDTTLEGAFPAEIDGQPVTGVESASFLAMGQQFGEPEEVAAFVSGMQAIGVDPAAVSFASGEATVDGESVTIQALRTPGGSAANAIPVIIALDPPEVPPAITAETIGGKQVTVSTFDDGEEDYYYTNGDLAWLLDRVDRAQAELILAALP